MKAVRIFLVLPIFIAACYTGDEVPPDQEIWEYAFPSDVGMSENGLLEINSGIYSGSFQSVRSMIIIKDDKLVFENYYLGDQRSSVRSIGRSTPIVTVLALGIAIEEGFLGGVTTPINDVLPIQYDDIFASDPTKRQITIEHLLLNRSGLSWNEGVRNLGDPRNDINAVQGTADWVRYVLEQPMEAQPDTRFNLNSMAGMVIAKAIETVVDQPFEEFVQEKLFDPLGIQEYWWSEDPAGNINAGTGFSTTTLELTKLGYLYLKEGLWQGERIVSEAWIEDAVTVRLQITNTINYGYGWHLFADELNFPKLTPNDTYFFPQHIFINPAKNMVIAFSTDNLFLPTFSPPLFLYTEVITPFIQ